MRNSKFKKTFKDAQGRILECKFALLKVEDDNTLYHLEFAVARYFDMSRYNSFKTH